MTLWQDLGGAWPPGIGPEPHHSTLQSAVNLRKSRFPLPYITGWAHFYGRPFLVLPGVFIPRMDTEILYLAFKEFFPDNNLNLVVSDVGTGTACISITIALEYPNSKILSIDLSKIAIKNAAFNIRMWDVTDRVHPILSNGLNSLKKNSLDGVIINPPYIPTALIQYLPKEVQHEPIIAIDGGSNGLQTVRTLLSQIRDSLKKNGLLIMETPRYLHDRLINSASVSGFFLEDIKMSLNDDILAIILRRGR